ncbi:dipeptide/oligopeptide/nickel ABC transporter permease/ATP-binding protein [Paenibacillus sp. S3N08]|uniref:Dipeptide/oligopeptide/nickel ABC transporter permease/ATP-binding protein n=2 Tax=Paenibacillus agricola TaxID=2716264 RepID=A0ABX0J9V0_9BACL|nr:dipeptide/oligopeptide/nickel ABC transporter permease/ATP-binding protein [Paenibacillus agricola]
MGQDILAELVVGARVSLSVGLLGALAVLVIGTIIGLVAGYWGGRIDAIFMRIIDISMTLPFLPLMIVIGVFLGPSWTTQIMVIALVMWSKVARETRSQILSLRTRGPVLAARSMGAGDFYLLRKHIFPGVVPLIIPQFVQTVNVAIMMESSLSFLGLGDPLTKSWGSMLYYANARGAFLTDAWLWWVLPAGLGIVITVLAFSFIGYWLEERVSPRLRTMYRIASNKNKQARSEKLMLDESLSSIIEVDKLTVVYPKDQGMVTALSEVSFNVGKGEVVGIVGESGSGKSTIAAAIMQLLKPPGEIQQGSIRLYGCDLASLSSEELRKARGSKIALIPQAAMNALNPVLTIRTQLAEAVLCHRRMNKESLNRRIDQLLEQVGMAARWGSAYPHELSGGMRQRVVIAMALINEPEFVIADEPTTGLDVKVQVEIINLLRSLQKQLGLSMIFISHDLPVVLRLADRIIILKQGEIVDEGATDQIAHESNHVYTRRLIDSIPRLKKRNTPSDQGAQQAELVLGGTI